MGSRVKVAISGATGFIGKRLSVYLSKMGYEVLPLSRNIFAEDAKLKDVISQAHIVINLAGAPINRCWTQGYKKKLYVSRVLTTRRIVEVINQLEEKPALFISTSAIGFYSDKGCYNEYNAQKGTGFLSNLCQNWEDEARKVSSDVRLVIARLGVVLSDEGGAFPQMLFSTKLKVASVIGGGNQYFSWIGIDDLLAALKYIIDNPSLENEVNLVAPQKMQNKEMLVTIAKYYKSWLMLRIPSLVIRSVLGEAAEFVTTSLCIEPKKLEESEFTFSTPNFDLFCEKLIQK